MKKYVSIILAVVLAFSISIVAFAAKYIGDANNDGNVSAIDARLVLQYAAGTIEYTEDDVKVCDTNGDGKITAVDARKVLQFAAGLIPLEEIQTKPGINVGEGENDSGISWGDITEVK